MWPVTVAFVIHFAISRPSIHDSVVDDDGLLLSRRRSRSLRLLLLALRNDGHRFAWMDLQQVPPSFRFPHGIDGLKYPLAAVTSGSGWYSSGT